MGHRRNCIEHGLRGLREERRSAVLLAYWLLVTQYGMRHRCTHHHLVWCQNSGLWRSILEVHLLLKWILLLALEPSRVYVWIFIHDWFVLQSCCINVQVDNSWGRMSLLERTFLVQCIHTKGGWMVLLGLYRVSCCVRNGFSTAVYLLLVENIDILHSIYITHNYLLITRIKKLNFQNSKIK